MKWKKQTITTIYVIFFFVVGMSIGKLFTDGLETNFAKPTEIKQYVTDGESKVLVFTTTYGACQHTSTYSDQIKVSFQSQEDLLNSFPGWSIVGGDESQIILNKEVEGYCDEHYKAVLDQDKLTISSLNTDVVLYQINMNGFPLGEEERKKLEEGLQIDSKQELTSFMEDFTS